MQPRTLREARHPRRRQRRRRANRQRQARKITTRPPAWPPLLTTFLAPTEARTTLTGAVRAEEQEREPLAVLPARKLAKPSQREPELMLQAGLTARQTRARLLNSPPRWRLFSERILPTAPLQAEMQRDRQRVPERSPHLEQRRQRALQAAFRLVHWVRRDLEIRASSCMAAGGKSRKWPA